MIETLFLSKIMLKYKKFYRPILPHQVLLVGNWLFLDNLLRQSKQEKIYEPKKRH